MGQIYKPNGKSCGIKHLLKLPKKKFWKTKRHCTKQLSNTYFIFNSTKRRTGMSRLA